jgi:FixJ family two-component response regulator
MDIDKTPTPAIFVVDDSNAVLLAATECLSRAGFMAFPFPNPDECEKIMGAMCPRVIVCDYDMPGFRNGVEFMHDVHRNQPDRMKIEFVFVTGHTGPLDTDGYPVIRKPYRAEALIAHVNQAVQRMMRKQGLGGDDEIFMLEIEHEIRNQHLYR